MYLGLFPKLIWDGSDNLSGKTESKIISEYCTKFQWHWVQRFHKMEHSLGFAWNILNFTNLSLSNDQFKFFTAQGIKFFLTKPWPTIYYSFLTHQEGSILWKYWVFKMFSILTEQKRKIICATSYCLWPNQWRLFFKMKFCNYYKLLW